MTTSATASAAIAKYKQFLTRTGFDEKSYQVECFVWCLAREQAQAAPQAQAQQASQEEQAQHTQAEQVVAEEKKGGILALEMGLGKTIIMLALIEANIKQTLIVLPRSLLDQWEENIQKTFGHNPLVYHGSRPKSQKMSLAEVAKRRIVITTYGQLALSIKPRKTKQGWRQKKKSILHSIKWARVICDEAHNVSHHKTTVFSGLISLQFNICWLVTGTPIQNNVKEIYNLFCLLGVAVPSPRKGEDTDCYLGSLPIEKYVFQGTKAGVGLIIAPLSEHTETLDWANEEEREFAAHIHSLVPMCNVPIQDELAQSIFDSEDPRSTRMKYLARARKICTYPPGVGVGGPLGVPPHHDGQGGETDDEVGGVPPETDDEEDDDKDEEGGVGGIPPAGKVDAVMKTIVERQLNGNGKIIFCHYYDEIDAFEKRLLSLGLTVAKFDGRVPNGQRSKILNEPVDILLAQIKMCREGLNLQVNYNEVYFPSPHWNPAVESQAIARCWRIGQTKPVYVFRYLMAEPTGVPPPHDKKGSALSNPPPISDPTQAPSRGGGTPIPFSIDEYTEKIQQRKKDIIEGLQIHAQLCA